MAILQYSKYSFVISSNFLVVVSISDNSASWGENFAGSSGLSAPIDWKKEDDLSSVVCSLVDIHNHIIAGIG